jgi:hypothetical protein
MAVSGSSSASFRTQCRQTSRQRPLEAESNHSTLLIRYVYAPNFSKSSSRRDSRGLSEYNTSAVNYLGSEAAPPLHDAKVVRSQSHLFPQLPPHPTTCTITACKPRKTSSEKAKHCRVNARDTSAHFMYIERSKTSSCSQKDREATSR